MNIYKTNDIAQIIGIHVNTVRLYEKWGLISKPKRKENGYRIFTDLHIEQFRLARALLQIEIVQNGLRELAVNIIKASAEGDYETASALTEQYIKQINLETENAEEAVSIARSLLANCSTGNSEGISYMTRKDAAALLYVTIDTLRNWELNGLLTVKRHKNGYRIYSAQDLQRLKIIRSLRCASYSLSSILRMLQALSADPSVNIREAINTPGTDDDIISVCDRLLTSLNEAKKNALFAAGQIEKMKNMPEFRGISYIDDVRVK